MRQTLSQRIRTLEASAKSEHNRNDWRAVLRLLPRDLILRMHRAMLSATGNEDIIKQLPEEDRAAIADAFQRARHQADVG